MDYLLQNDGDCYEVKYWPELDQVFLNYEVFWKRFIVPLTLRVEDKGISLKSGTNPILEEMAMSHYSVFYHLGVAGYLQSRLDQEFPEDILFHLSASSEMVERFILILVKLLNVCKEMNLIDPISEEDFNTIVQRYRQKDYQEHFERFSRSGQSINITLQNIDDVSKRFFQELGEQAQIDYKEWRGVVGQLRHYRNVLAHNPKLGNLLDIEGVYYVPKEDKLFKYELWSSVSHGENLDDFVPLHDLLSGFQAHFVSITNSLWNHVINFMEEITKTDLYSKLIEIKEAEQSGPTVLFEKDRDDELPISPAQSGTSSYDPFKGSWE